MSDPRPDTDEHAEPGGSPTHEQGSLIRKPVTPGTDDGGAATVPGAYEADDDEKERGRAVKPGN